MGNLRLPVRNHLLGGVMLAEDVVQAALLVAVIALVWALVEVFTWRAR